jgi:hypothetical protein
MKKSGWYLIIGVIAIIIIFMVASRPTTGAEGQNAGVFSSFLSLFSTGNGGPSGAHYNLNIIGVPKAKSADMTGGDGHRIFVGLGSNKPADPVTTKIMLTLSTDGTFKVLDANGTDGTASFSLPAPGTYSIWARPLGKPGGESKVTSCATDPVTGEEICSTSNEVFIRDGGKSTFRNVTTALTTIDLDSSLTDVIDACGGATTVSLFNPCLEGYFWNYDNNGLRLLQLRFYQN